MAPALPAHSGHTGQPAGAGAHDVACQSTGRGASAIVYGPTRHLKTVEGLKNVDLVRYIEEDDAQGVRIVFSGENNEATILQIGGEEAIALWRCHKKSSHHGQVGAFSHGYTGLNERHKECNEK